MDEHTDEVIAPEVARLLVRETRGNPFALTELMRILEPEELSGRRALRLPLPVGPGLERALVRRIETLPSTSQEALLVAAASDTGAMDEIAAAIHALGVPRGSLDAAEEAGVVVIASGRLEFAHPLMRSAVYNHASMPTRRRCHRALAQAIASPDRRAWQLAASTDAPDESVAQALEMAASEASARSGYGAASAALERSARLTPGEADRARRLLAAASTSHLAGRSRHASALLEEALVLASEPLLRAEIQQMRGTVLLVSGGPFVAADLLMKEAEAIAARAPDRAALMLFDAAWAYEFTARAPQGARAARRAFEIAPQGPLRAVAGLILAAVLLLEGETGEASDLLDASVPALRSVEPPLEWRSKALAAQAYGWVGRYDLAESLVEDSLAGARLAGAIEPLPHALAVACEIRYRTGDWTRAYAAGTEGARLGLETGQEPMAAASLVAVGRIHAARGQFDQALAAAARAAESTDRVRTEPLRVHIGSVLGLLEIGRGRGEEAVVFLERARRAGHASGLENPDVVPFWGDLVEAYVLAARPDDARRVTADLEVRVEATGSPLASALAPRCRGLLEDDFEPFFEEALRRHETAANPFEMARTHLAYGERLRRANRRADARAHLRAASGIFHSLDATPWARRAEAELTATGERMRRPSAVDTVRLTPQELQVALVVAGGATNREAAASLFLSPKTVEFHLSNVYAKLGLRSRAELAARVAAGGLAAQG